MKNILIKMMYIVGLFTLTACESKKGENDPSVNSKKQEVKSVYRVGSELSKFPVVMHDPKTGSVSGFEAELLAAVAEKQGFALEYTIDSWDGLLTKLEKKEADLILGSVTITDERKQRMDFSDPVVPYKVGVMVTQKLDKVKSFKDLKGRKISLRKNTIYERFIPTFANENGSNLVYPDSVWGQVQSLINGETEGMLDASTTLEYYKKQNPDKNLRIIYEDGEPISHYGWAVQKGDTELLNRLNMGLYKVKQDGTYDQIYQKYWAK